MTTLDPSTEQSIPRGSGPSGHPDNLRPPGAHRLPRRCPADGVDRPRRRAARARRRRDVGPARRHRGLAPIPVPGALRPVTGADIRMGTRGLLRCERPSIDGPHQSWAGLSRALKPVLSGEASALAAAVAIQFSAYSLPANACLDYVPQVRTWDRMQQRPGRPLARTYKTHRKSCRAPARELAPPGDQPTPTTGRARCPHTRRARRPRPLGRLCLRLRLGSRRRARIAGSDLLTRTGDWHTPYIPMTPRSSRRHPSHRR
jgi:hypothetical protein